MSSHHVVILAGGKGTRLRPFTATFPKPLVPLGDMPILAIILRQLINQGFEDVTLTLGHLAELIRAYISQHPIFSRAIRINFVDEDSPTGTAGSLANVRGLSDTFLVMNGDILTNINYNSLIKDHKQSGAALTIAGHQRQVKIDLGVLETDESGRLNGYVEKPEHNFQVSMGIYVYDKRVLRFIAADAYLDFPTLVHKLLQAGEPVQVHRNDAFWLDIGRPEDYATAQKLFEEQPEYFGIGSFDPCVGNTAYQNRRLDLKKKAPYANA
jgi:NDP-mannose synthase